MAGGIPETLEESAETSVAEQPSNFRTRALSKSRFTPSGTKAKTEYHKTKDILTSCNCQVRDMKTTLIYTQLIEFESNDHRSAVAKTIEEARSLIETGFEYVTDVDGVKLFRKRK